MKNEFLLYLTFGMFSLLDNGYPTFLKNSCGSKHHELKSHTVLNPISIEFFFISNNGMIIYPCKEAKGNDVSSKDG